MCSSQCYSQKEKQKVSPFSVDKEGDLDTEIWSKPGEAELKLAITAQEKDAGVLTDGLPKL